MWRKILFLVLISVSLSSIAQYDFESLQYLHEKYKDQDAVILKRAENISIDFDKHDSVFITNNIYETKYFLTDKAKYYADEHIFFSSFTVIENIKAYYYNYTGEKYKKTAVKESVTENRYSSSIFYDSNKTTKIPFPKVGKYDQSEISYTEISKEPHFLGNYYFSSYLPMEEIEISVSFPSNVTLIYKTFNDPDNKISFSETEKKGITTYIWRMKDAKKYSISDESFSISYYKPHIALLIKDYTINGKTTKVLSDVAQLYSWYNDLTCNINKGEDPKLKALVDSLTRDKENDLDKIKAIYYWVQSNITYVAFEDGYSGFVPREAKDIYHKRYGDCKDMSSIMHEMFSYTDIPAYLTWIGTRDIPYSYYDLPTTSADNHMILTVNCNDSLIFLDGTANFLSIELPSSFTQGKEALIGIDSTTYKVQKVPVIPKEKNLYLDSSYIYIDNGLLKGKSIAYINGYQQYNITSHLVRQPKTKYEKIIADYFEKGSNKFKLDSFNIVGEIRRDSTFIIEYYYSIPDYVKHIGNDYYINMNLNTDYKRSHIDTANREYDQQKKYKFIDTHVSALSIPEGYKLERIPENSEYKQDHFGFSINYSLNTDGTVLTMEKTFYLDALRIRLNEFDDWNAMIDILNKAYNKAVQLTKK